MNTLGLITQNISHANANDITSIEEETDEEQTGFSSAEMFDMWQNKYSENLLYVDLGIN